MSVLSYLQKVFAVYHLSGLCLSQPQTLFPRARFSRPFVCISSQEDATNPTARTSTKSYDWPCRFAGICALLMATVRWQSCSRGKMAGFFDMVAAEGPTQREIRLNKEFSCVFPKEANLFNLQVWQSNLKLPPNAGKLLIYAAEAKGIFHHLRRFWWRGFDSMIQRWKFWNLPLTL